MSIANFIKVETAYTRSVNLERDSKKERFEAGYIPTSRALRTLDTLTSRFDDSDQPRAWSLIGPYGSGKSSFALFLSQLLSNPKSEKAKAALAVLKSYDKTLSKRIQKETKDSHGYVEVLISGTPEPLSLRYLRGLYFSVDEYWQSLARKGRKPNVLTAMREDLDRGQVSISQLVQHTKDCQVAVGKVGCPGLLIIFDEFGKFLEYESRFLGVNDVFLLQELAEHAHSAADSRLLLFVLLHQSIEQYARGVGESLKNEWAKIQGRFEEVPFLESAEQTLRVVAAAISPQNFDVKTLKKIETDTKRAVKTLSREGVLPSSLTEAEAIELFVGLYPLHPLTAMILPQLCQLISQNERTLFSYLGSHEQNGFKNVLEGIETLGEFIPPHYVFDYFLANQPTVNGDYLTQRRWAESVSVIERASNASEEQISILKTIGLINLLGNRGSLKASEALITSAYGNSSKNSIEGLISSSSIVHRKFNNEYRVWQGSDFDLEAKLQDQLNQLGTISVAEEVTNNQSLSPIVARKYSIKNGVLRYFTLVFVDALSYKKVEPGLTPKIIIYLGLGSDDEDHYHSKAMKYLSNIGVVGYSKGGHALRNIVEERLALEDIERSSKELGEDPVARKEFELRLSTVRQAERRQVTQLTTDPRGSEWSFKGETLSVKDRREFQEVLTSILEDLYPKSPKIFNELINRDKPSSQAAAARNKLMGLMISEAASREDFGIAPDRFPPEKSIYRAVLKNTGIHKKTKDGWKLAVPPKNSSIYPAWMFVEQFLDSTESNAKSFTEINAELLAPPYGVKAGVLPILWLAVYLVSEHELALYEERRYIPGFTVEGLERFVKRPDQFSLQRFKIEGMRASVFKQYKSVVSGGREPESVLDIAKPLASFMGQLPEYTLKTKSGLSKRAISVREAFKLAKSPEQLVFEGLPKALGFGDLSEVNDGELEGFAEALTEILRELKNAHSSLRESLKGRLAGVLGLDSSIDLAQLREQSKGRCYGLESYTLDTQGVRGLLLRINREEQDDERWLENILMFLGSKPSAKWTDADRDEAEYKLTVLSRRLTDLFKLAAQERGLQGGSEHEFDVYLLKSLKKGCDFIDEFVAIDEQQYSASRSLKEELQSILGQASDRELKLATLAQLVDEFLREYRAEDSNKSQDSDAASLRQVGEGS